MTNQELLIHGRVRTEVVVELGGAGDAKFCLGTSLYVSRLERVEDAPNGVGPCLFTIAGEAGTAAWDAEAVAICWTQFRCSCHRTVIYRLDWNSFRSVRL